MDLEQWKVQKLIKDLKSYQGAGTSVITMYIKAGAQIAPERQRLTDEMGTASNIKSRVNRQSVLSAITSTQQMLKKYTQTPANGLAVFCGEVTKDGKTKKVSITFEPPKPLGLKFYMCDDHFHVDELNYLLDDAKAYGFVVVDGKGALFAKIQGTIKTILSSFDVDLPKKHNKGGQSSVRFARLRDEAIDNYIRKVCETINRTYISGDSLNIAGLILAGSGNKKDLVRDSPLLDYRITLDKIHTVDISYGGENGLNQAIADSAGLLDGLKLAEERDAITKFMNEIAVDSGKVCYGLKATLTALETGVIEHLICWSDLEETREDGSDLLEWLVENYSNYGVERLSLVTDATAEGMQFVQGFKIGAVLRYKVEMDLDLDLDLDPDDDPDFSGFI